MFDFKSITNRHDTGCVKWDAPSPLGSSPEADVIPMWVADMDFKAAPCIIEAMQRRLDHGVFGYTYVPQRYYDSVINWFSRRYSWDIKKEWIKTIPGLVPAMAVVINALTEPGDKVIVQSPVYNCFFGITGANGRKVLDNPLKYVDTGDGLMTWEMDFDDLERKAADPDAKLMMLCSPHNPAGRVWPAETIAKVGEICRRHGVIVVSDEIHCELVQPGVKFTPYPCVSEGNASEFIVFNSPTKAFNIAGLEISNIVTNVPEWMEKIVKVINANEMGMLNPFGVEALMAAYNEGEPWLDGLNSQMAENWNYLRDLFARELPDFRLTKLEGTYLVWLDCSPVCGMNRVHGQPDAQPLMTALDLEKSLIENEKVWINTGGMYGLDGFIRINIACPPAILQEGLRRIVRGLKRLQARV